MSDTIHHHITRYLLTDLKIAEVLASGFYVDDFTSGAQNVEEGFDVYRRAKQVMEQGEFNLCKWITNNKPLQQRINMVEGRHKN